VCLTAIAAAGCSDGQVTGPSTHSAAVTSNAQGADRIGFLSRNLYVGTDLDALVAALISSDPNDDLPALFTAIETAQETNWPGRVEALADEIARYRPHFVGLQEVSSIDIDLTALGIPVAIHQDFLADLLAELSERGLDYSVGSVVENIEAAPIPGIDLLDRDALLVDDSRVDLLSSDAANYTFNIGPVAPGVVIQRGWVAVAANVDGRELTVASTHLESGDSPPIAALRAAQALELLVILGSGSPIVIMGDLNDTPGSPMYEVVTGAAFLDAWAAMRPRASGYTCCHLPDLSNRVNDFDQRIDYVMVRGLTGPSGRLQGRVSVIGDEPGSRVPGPEHRVWPSDHAGVFADVLLPPAVGLAAH
jgi:endonuclease/exonuclease/phosphatase family metal-dependent hydrolase